MTSILPSGSRASMLGAGLGGGFSNQVSQMMPTLFERDLIQKGLKNIEDMSPDQMDQMRKNPLSAMTKVMGSLAGTRQGAQYAEPVLNYMMKMMESGQKGSPEAVDLFDELDRPVSKNSQREPPSQGGPQEQPETLRMQVVDDIKKSLGEQYFPNYQKPMDVEGKEGFRPQKPLEAPKILGAKEKAVIRSKMIKRGIKDPESQKSILEDVEKGRIQEYEAAKEGFKNVKDYQQARIDEDNRFFSNAEPLINQAYGNLGPQKFNIWKGMSRLAENQGTDEDRMRNTSQMFDQVFYEPVSSFRNLAPSLPTASLMRPEATKSYLDDARGMVQDHIKAVNERPDIPDQLKSEISNQLRDEYMSSLVEKDWGTAQSAYAVSNLNPKWGDRLPEAKRESEGVKAGAGRGGLLISEPPIVDRDKAVNSLTNELLKLGKDDSLILAREKTISKNYDEQIFNEALNRAIAQGLKLSDYQRMERPKLSIAQRLTLDDIMRGKRDYMDIFKGKK